MQETPKSKIDPYFGISYNNKGDFYMGNKVFELSGYDIITDGITYQGTLGLWPLILLRKPDIYKPDDMKKYKKLVKQTKVMANPQNLKVNI